MLFVALCVNQAVCSAFANAGLLAANRRGVVVVCERHAGSGHLQLAYQRRLLPVGRACLVAAVVSLCGHWHSGSTGHIGELPRMHDTASSGSMGAQQSDMHLTCVLLTAGMVCFSLVAWSV